ncbi:hypothetical protein OIU76_017887, partial [Salix suchowensis]
MGSWINQNNPVSGAINHHLTAFLFKQWLLDGADSLLLLFAGIVFFLSLCACDR